MPSRLKAVVLLAWALFRTLIAMLIGKRSGLRQFRLNYSAEGLSTVSPSQRFQMARFGRCIACGRCDRGDKDLIERHHGQFQSTMALVLAASRSMPEFQATQLSFGLLDSKSLRAKERLCPTRVPLSELASFVADHAEAQSEGSVPE